MKNSRKLILVVVSFICGLSLNAQPLDTLLREVVENNPELKALALEYEAELLRIDQVRELPNPQLGVGIPISPPETRLGPQILMVSASQMFPWFGTLDAKEEVVISMSKVRYEKISALRLVLFNKVKVAYTKIAFVDAKIIVMDSIIDHFEALSRIVIARVETNASSAANVLRIQLRIDDLKQQIKKMNLEKQSLYAVINGITNANFEKVIEADQLDTGPLLLVDTDQIRQSLRAHYPLMLKIDQQIEVSKGRTLLNKKMGSPSLAFGLDYALVSKRTDASPAGNGRDIFVPKVMVSIPIYRKGFKARDKQELLIQDALNLHKDDLENRIIAEIITLETVFNQGQLDIELAKSQLKTADHVYSIILTEYSVNGRNFDDLLELENLMLTYKLQMISGIFNATKAVLDIEKYTDF